MMADAEEYFPRGGKKPTTTYFKQSGNFLGAAEKGERKRKKQKKKSDDDDGYLSDDNSGGIDKSYKNCASRLSYKSIKQGVTLLGRVRQVHETKLVVCLPGNMSGAVMACHISEAYNKLLEAYVNDQIDKVKELSEIYRPGQYVAVSVLEVEGNRLMLSMMPQHVNTGRTHSNIVKGDIYQAAVSSVEDHGYVMDIGIPNTRPFLPKKNINPEIELDTGMTAWCCVKSVTSSTDSSIVTLSNELAALQNASPRRDSSLPLLPATPLNFVVDKPLDNGIEGHVFDDRTAYIQRQHADKVKGKKPALGQKVKARVLYVIPTRKTPFLTMKDVFAVTYPDLSEEKTIKEGDIIEEAQVLRIVGRCVHFKLGRGSVGAMSFKHVPVDEDLADEQIVAKSYPIGSTHRVRVISYNPSDFVYLVSDQPAVLQQRYFSLDQLQPGDMVEATIKTVADNHLLVDVDRLLGYIPQSHYTDAGVFVDPKKASQSKLSKKFKEGQAVRARVLTIDRARQGLLLTMKPSLLAEDVEVLSSYHQAQVGKAYTGFIRFVRDYILVSFFNNVTAIVPRHYVTKEPLESLSGAFHNGQIVNCTILQVDPENKKMNGSLTTLPFWPQTKRENKGKRKPVSDNADEVPRKKQKNDEPADTQGQTKKKKKKTREEDIDGDSKEMKKKRDKARTDSESNIEDEASDRKKKKSKNLKSTTEEVGAAEEEVLVENEIENRKKKKKKKMEEVTKSSEESDTIETDIHEDSDHVLTPQDLILIDLSDCTDVHKCKKKIVSLMKNVNARTRRMDKIDEKIQRIEDIGLSIKNKKYHTAMHTEKLVIEERIKKLLETVNVLQEKLKDFGYDAAEDPKNKKKATKVKAKEKQTKVKDTVKEEKPNRKETKEKKKDIKEKKKDIKVVESLEPVLEVSSAKDYWSVGTDPAADNVAAEESSSSDEEEQEQPKKKRKKLTVAEKLAKVREEEEKVRELEKRAIESESQPRSSEQFERAVLANPDCSQIWIAYMAFHLQSTELDKARAVGRRALRTITFREEAERLNVWLALLNCEIRFGTKESSQAILEEALQMNEPIQVHTKLLDMYVETSKPQELASLVDLMVRKYRRDPAVYVACGTACFGLGLVDKARAVMQKAISVLDKKEHVAVLVQFALLERGAGGRERAEALFEQVLAVYPQRVDVAAAYLDMLRKAGDLEHLRQVMERMTAQKLPARKMKILYKKWIEIEEKMGDADKVEEIKQRAMEYIEKAKF